MKLAVVAPKWYGADEAQFKEALNEVLTLVGYFPTFVVSEGSALEKELVKIFPDTIVVRTEWERYRHHRSNPAGNIRNAKMAVMANAAIVFDDQASSNVFNFRAKMKTHGRPVYEVEVKKPSELEAPVGVTR